MELKHVKLPDDVYLCRSDLMMIIGKIRDESGSEESRHNLQVIIDIINESKFSSSVILDITKTA